MMSAFNYGIPAAESIVGSINSDVTRFVDDVCDIVEIDFIDVLSPSRQRHVVDLRHLLMYIMRHDFEMHFHEIGRFMQRHHATAIHANNKISGLLEINQITLFFGTYLQAAQTVYQSHWGRNLKIFEDVIRQENLR